MLNSKSIAHIVPVKNLDYYTPEECGYEMYLTHLVEKYPEKFQEHAKKSKAYKILDNSLIELGSAVDFQRVLDAAEVIGADEVILPDVFRNCGLTLQAVDKALGLKIPSHLKLMAVCQGEDVANFEHCFHVLNGIPEIDVIGIPKICAKMHPCGRPAFEHLWFSTAKEIHLLGLWYSFMEYTQYLFPDRIRSTDTCQAAFLTKHKLDLTSIRPDGFTIDLENDDINRRGFNARIEELSAWIG